MNFLLTTPDPVYYDSLCIGTNRENAQFIHDAIKKVIDEIGVQKILAVITDNVSANVRAWELLDETYVAENLSFYGCASLIGQLLIKDYGPILSVKTIIDSVSKMVNEIKKSRILLSVFKEIQKNNPEDQKKITLKIAGKTRWGSHLRCLKSFYDNKINLQRLAISEKVIGTLDLTTKDKILSDRIWWEIQKVMDLLQPVLDWITIWEGDSIRLSLVVRGILEIGKNVQAYLNEAPLIVNLTEARNLRHDFNEGAKMALKPIHFAAYFLDPRYREDVLNQEDFDTGYKYIFSILKKFTNVSKNDLVKEVADYYSKSGFYEQDHVQTTSKILDPVQWWKTTCDKRSLSKIAVAILQSPPTSAATGRSFSTEGFMHNAQRNRLLRSKLVTSSTTLIFYLACKNLKYLCLRMMKTMTKLKKNGQPLQTRRRDKKGTSSFWMARSQKLGWKRRFFEGFKIFLNLHS